MFRASQRLMWCCNMYARWRGNRGSDVVAIPFLGYGIGCALLAVAPALSPALTGIVRARARELAEPLRDSAAIDPVMADGAVVATT